MQQEEDAADPTMGNEDRSKNIKIAQEPQRILKRAHSLVVSHRQTCKRRRRAGSDCRILPPVSFLLGGNINDPLNLNGLLEQAVDGPVENRQLPFFVNCKNARVAGRARSNDELSIPVARPRDVTDPLNLNGNFRRAGVTSSVLPYELNTVINPRDEIVPPLLPIKHGGPGRARRRRRGSSRAKQEPGVADTDALREGNAGLDRSRGRRRNRKRVISQVHVVLPYLRAADARYRHGCYPRGDEPHWCGEDPRLTALPRDWIFGRRVLDVGCGTGKVAIQAARDFGAAEVIGIDIDKKIVQYARQDLWDHLWQAQDSCTRAFSQAPNNSDSATEPNTAPCFTKNLTPSPVRKFKSGVVPVRTGSNFSGRPGSRGIGRLCSRTGPSAALACSPMGRTLPCSLRTCLGPLVPGVLPFAQPLMVEKVESEGAVAEIKGDDVDARDAQCKGRDQGLKKISSPILQSQAPSLPIGLSSSQPCTFPYNVAFLQANAVPSETPPNTREATFDLVLCLNVTKWIHLCGGDTALRNTLLGLAQRTRPGGRLVLQAQPLSSYARHRHCTETILGNYQGLKLYPDSFDSLLLSPEAGFCSCQILKLPRHTPPHLRYPLQVFNKSGS
uniref:7SK snRNA methylphosphate capping enzyme-like n=1 Tax=Myxine glutinosa TaxID=7769 RepID=UPI00358F5034